LGQGHITPRLRDGAVSFQRVCFSYAKDDFDTVRLSDKIRAVRSFTFDFFAGSPTPPLVATVIDVEGARLYRR